MLRIILLSVLLCSIFSFDSNATPPNKIYSITRQNLPAAYYQEQATLWKQEIERNQKNENAWFNYFMAHQVLLEKGKISPTQLEQISQELQTALPQSFEAAFAKFIVNQDSKTLLKAYQLAPQRHELYPYLLEYYEQEQTTEKTGQLCQQWLASGEYSSGLLEWNYNALIGLEKNAVILTEGINHTHPLWLLQYGKNIRPDVQVLNLRLLTNSSYRKEIFNRLGLPILLSNNKADIVEHLLQHLQKQAMYLGISISKGLVKNHEEELYVIGLAFRHSPHKFDNIKALVDNYENKFLLDHLHINLSHDVSQELVNKNNINYLPAFLILHDYYKEQNDWKKAEAIKALSLKIATAADKEQQLEAYLNKNFDASSTKPLVKISHYEIEDAFTPMDYNINLYAGLTEVTNEAYELFLNDLIKRKEFDQLQSYKIYKTDWRSFLADAHKNLADDVVFMHGSPNHPEAPIQNISYESAVAYCDWLTEVYNNIEHKKKRFKRVQFRLPTEKEWELAASTLSPNSKQYTFDEAPNYLYPWLGPFYKNSLGCFLGNFNVNDKGPCEDCDARNHPARDGAFFPVKVGTYFPNNYDMYNTVGNVAEMIQEKGKAKGGSWFHPPLECTINETQNYKEPQPYIGFRVFMEVLEEAPSNLIKKGPKGPPNTLHLTGNLYMDETEVSNVDWDEYVYWVNKNEKNAAALALIQLDTTVWDSVNFPQMTKVYHSHPAYMNYPVVGVTQAQAEAYCKWRSDRVNEAMALNSPHKVKKFGTVRYRLPTEKEWEYAAAGGLSFLEYPYGFYSNSPSEFSGNLMDTQHEREDKAVPTVPFRNYYANEKGYYDMIGNVAELVQEKGIAKGGSWNNKLSASKIKYQQKVKQPAATVGFRCICETNL